MSIETTSLSPKQARVYHILWFVFSIVLLLNMAVTPVTTSVVYASSTDTSQSFANNSNPICYDITGDGVVNMFDFLALTIAFGSYPGHPNWNPEADLNDDNIVDIFDAVIMNTGAHTVVERFWSADSYWRQKIPLNAPLHPNSAQMINWLFANHGGVAPHLNWDYYTSPVYEADENTPRVTVYRQDKVTPRYYNIPLKSSWQPSPDIESYINVIDWPNKVEYECWSIAYDGDRWYCSHSQSTIYKWDLTGTGVVPREQWAVGSSSCPLIAMIIRDEDIKAGVINHPLKCGLSTPKKHYYVWPPAARTHGQSTHSYAIPNGARIQLNPDLDLDSLGLTRTQKIIAKACQEWGIVVAEESGGWRLYCEGESSVEGGWAQYGLSSSILQIPEFKDNWRIVDYGVFSNEGVVGALYYME